MGCSDFFSKETKTLLITVFVAPLIVKVRRALKQGWLLVCRPKPTADDERWDEHVDMMARSAEVDADPP